MQFTPKTEKEIAEEGLIQPGTYDFEVMFATDDISGKGNEMIILGLNVFDDSGRARSIKDYLLESMAYKLRHAADACDLISQYESGNLVASDFVGKTGKLKIVIQKDKAGQYPDKNSVQDYIKRENLVDAHTKAKGDSFQSELGHPAFDDSIPF